MWYHNVLQCYKRSSLNHRNTRNQSGTPSLLLRAGLSVTLHPIRMDFSYRVLGASKAGDSFTTLHVSSSAGLPVGENFPNFQPESPEMWFSATDYYCWFNEAIKNLWYLGLEVGGQRETGQEGGKTNICIKTMLQNLLAQHKDGVAFLAPFFFSFCTKMIDAKGQRHWRPLQ